VRRASIAGAPALAVDAYDTTAGREHFVSLNTADDRLAGFLRLLLPAPEATALTAMPELAGGALIREVHVYGPVVRLGEGAQGEAQHLGLGARLLAEAERLARQAGYRRLAVIAAVGTRAYYRRHGFEVEGLYMTRPLR
jgi:elongator complex protein 3